MNQIHDVVSTISSLSQEMEDKGRVDLGILPHLDALKSHISEIKAKLQSKNDPNAFLFYFALKTAGLYVEKMADRFVNAEANRDNPKIAVDTLALAPSLEKVISMADSDAFDTGAKDSILAETIKLRNVASKTDLLELEGSITAEPTYADLVKIADTVASAYYVDDEVPPQAP